MIAAGILSIGFGIESTAIVFAVGLLVHRISMEVVGATVAKGARMKSSGYWSCSERQLQWAKRTSSYGIIAWFLRYEIGLSMIVATNTSRALCEKKDLHWVVRELAQ